MSVTSVSLDELLSLRLHARHLRLAQSHSQHAAAGQQHSRLYGRGMDYAESRAYQPGDDIRRLDWRLTARSGKLHTKVFQEDRQGCLVLLLDTHATMQFGTRSCFKSVTAARAATLAAWLSATSGEQTGLVSFGQQELWLKPASGKRGALSLCHALSEPATLSTSPTSLSSALEQLRQLPQRPSRLLLLSDGFALTADDEKALLAWRKHSQLALLGIADVLEATPPASGHYALRTPTRTLNLTLTGRQRDTFFQQMNQGQQRLVSLAKRHGLPYAQLTTQDDPLPALGRLLGQRVRP